MTLAIDSEAREAAAVANNKIDKHEQHCGERWAQANKRLGELRSDVRDLHRRIDYLIRMAFVVVIGLAGFAVVQWLLARGIAA
ncbi:hypothetical protein HBA54_27665 [Pelagibius litoralis]|uniref:Haemolysin XhlA n=1 Tax=Pelagibius litoralis TaxID=374515 RepID=A0A967F365_9PROT|nr:hypothetical protein [Pelagibius litoralis]NIA72371.1 hypothetical protein [Pelagibius litoralis]